MLWQIWRMKPKEKTQFWKGEGQRLARQKGTGVWGKQAKAKACLPKETVDLPRGKKIMEKWD